LRMSSEIVGIVNLTADSFSDGGKYLSHELAVRWSLELVESGASIIDLGAESSHPDSEKVSVREEIDRLCPVVVSLKAEGIRVSVDTYKPDVMKAVLELGVDMINDITALGDSSAHSVVAEYDVPVVIMHSRSRDARAERGVWHCEDYMGSVMDYFRERIAWLESEGIRKERLIVDPGMGFFLGDNVEASLSVLRDLYRLKELGHKLYVSTSRKSFIGKVLDHPVTLRGDGTLATELWAALQGVDYIRTHNVKALRDGILMLSAIQNGGLE